MEERNLELDKKIKNFIGVPWDHDWESAFCSYCGESINSEPMPECVPPYSSSIQWAWEVIDKMRALMPHTRFSLLGTKDEAQGEGIKFGVHFVTNMGQGEFQTEGKAIADSAPMAICIAALKTQGIEGIET